jgi:sec-independent protein translocase protein TatA
VSNERPFILDDPLLSVTGWTSPWHLIIFALVVVLVFGAKRAPEIGRSLGTGMREFKHSVTAHHEELDRQEITASATELSGAWGSSPASDPRERDAI